MKSEVILVTGAGGQIGTELVTALQATYGHVIATDIKPGDAWALDVPYETANILDAPRLAELIARNGVTQVYHMAAILSAAGEKNPQMAWDVNMRGLLNVLDVCVAGGVKKVFYPSTIAVFGPHTPKLNSPQHTVTDPTTIYGITKLAGERWCAWYHAKHALDIRGLRYPGLISYKTKAGGGTTDYAVDIYYAAKEKGHYDCFLGSNTMLPMMYMPDAIRGTLALMEAPEASVTIRDAYNFAGMSFTPDEIAASIRKEIPGFSISYQPDYRQAIAESWPHSINDSKAQADWGWKPEFDLTAMTTDMLAHVGSVTV